jgi:hypothetical protein
MAIDLLVECKKGLNISLDNTAVDGLLNQKITAVKTFMQSAGVKAETLDSDAAVGAIVVGVTDLWELKSGEIKFSPVFYTLTTQLAMG